MDNLLSKTNKLRSLIKDLKKNYQSDSEGSLCQKTCTLMTCENVFMVKHCYSHHALCRPLSPLLRPVKTLEENIARIDKEYEVLNEHMAVGEGSYTDAFSAQILRFLETVCLNRWFFSLFRTLDSSTPFTLQLFDVNSHMVQSVHLDGGSKRRRRWRLQLWCLILKCVQLTLSYSHLTRLDQTTVKHSKTIKPLRSSRATAAELKLRCPAQLRSFCHISSDLFIISEIIWTKHASNMECWLHHM